MLGVKTSNLEGDALERLVAKCEGKASWIRGFTTEWEQAGPIIEREEIGLAKSLRGVWAAIKYDEQQRLLAFEDGPTPLIAAMRCYVASRLGDEVETPEELK